MIVRRFLGWIETAPAGKRAEGASALARAYLYSALAPDVMEEAAVALTSLLDDPSPLVRRAMAEAFASAVEAPHHIVAALAADQSDIAAIVLARSPVLADAELIDCLAIGDVFAQSAIAIRPRLSAPVAAALAEVGAREALISLAVNARADLPEFAMRRMIERMGDDGEVREALLSRCTLPVAMRHELVVATANALSSFVTARAWLSEERARRVAGEARERAVLTMIAEAGRDGARALVAQLRRTGALTAGLVLRSILSGDLVLFESALVELSQLSAARVAGLLREYSGAGFAALFKKAGFPTALLPVFRSALAAAREQSPRSEGGVGAGLSRPIIERVLAALPRRADGEFDRLFALLRRFEAEAAREEARQAARGMRAGAPAEVDLEAEIALVLSQAAAAEALQEGSVEVLTVSEIDTDVLDRDAELPDGELLREAA